MVKTIQTENNAQNTNFIRRENFITRKSYEDKANGKTTAIKTKATAVYNDTFFNVVSRDFLLPYSLACQSPPIAKPNHHLGFCKRTDQIKTKPKTTNKKTKIKDIEQTQ